MIYSFASSTRLMSVALIHHTTWIQALEICRIVWFLAALVRLFHSPCSFQVLTFTFSLCCRRIFFLLNAAHSTFSIFVGKKTIATRTLSHRHTHTHERAFTSIHATKIQLIHISVAPLKQPTHILSQIQKRFGSPKVLCMVKMRPLCQQSHTHTASIASIDFFSLVRCDSLLSCKSCTDLWPSTA